MGDVTFPNLRYELESVLLRRGHLPTAWGEPALLLYPGDRLLDIRATIDQFEFARRFPSGPLERYMAAFARPSFRKVARRLTRDGQAWVQVSELVAMAADSAGDHLDLLADFMILDRRSDEVRLTRPVDSLGASFEHYVAHVIRTELRGLAEWGVKLEGLPRAGGDFDVIAWLDPLLLYVECKTSRPSEVGERPLRQFLQRAEEFAPDLAVLLIDTDDDLTKFIDDQLNPTAAIALAHPGYQAFHAIPDFPGVAWGLRRVYVTNTRPSVVTQLRGCLQLFYAHVRGMSFYGGELTHTNYLG